MQSSRGFEYGVKHILSPQSGLISDIVSKSTSLSSENIQELFLLGAIYVNNRRLTQDAPVESGTYIRVHSRPRRFKKPQINLSESIVFANEEFIVIKKPAGLPVHASVDNIKENLISFLGDELNATLFVTHRLDVPTSGLLVLAKNLLFQNRFNQILADRKVKKKYRASVEGNLTHTGTLKHFMEPSPRAPKRVCRDHQEGHLECLLEIESAQATQENTSELVINLITGRTHQIRAQLAAEGHPILGDVAYGAKKIFTEEKIELEAFELNFENPLDQKMYHFSI